VFELTQGVMIVFEGLDGSGKTTQVRALRDRLAAVFPVTVTREPTSGPWGQRIRQLAVEGREEVTASEENELFIRDRKEDLEQTILPALLKRHIVLVDRYFYSNMAYQGARGLDPQQIKTQNLQFARVPELVLILDVSPVTGIERITHGRGETTNAFETAAGLTRVAEIYHNMTDAHIVHIEGNCGLSHVRAAIWREVTALLERFIPRVALSAFQQWANQHECSPQS